MIKKLTRTGDSAALVLDKQLLEAANMDTLGVATGRTTKAEVAVFLATRITR